jgi:hypothetical protein
MHHLSLDTLTLDQGNHNGPDDGTCLMEAVALFADEPFGANPRCVSQVLKTFGIRLNDTLPDDKRQLLKPLIPQLVGTAGDGYDEVRSYMALDWLIRTWTPAWLDLAGLTGEATALRDLRRIVDLVAAQQAGPVVRAAATKARAAWDAAGDAAWDAARDAAWDAARAAAWDAARDAAGAAARDAAWDAARAAAWDAAGDAAGAAAGAAAGDAAGDAARDAAGAAARDAARDAAGDAARAAAWDAARDAAGAAARDAAWDATRAKLQPTVDLLQNSAIELYQHMIRPDTPPVDDHQR